MPSAREAWEALFAGPLAGRDVTRVICTHFHPDHLGLAGWLTERFGVPAVDDARRMAVGAHADHRRAGRAAGRGARVYARRRLER